MSIFWGSYARASGLQPNSDWGSVIDFSNAPSLLFSEPEPALSPSSVEKTKETGDKRLVKGTTVSRIEQSGLKTLDLCTKNLGHSGEESLDLTHQKKTDVQFILSSVHSTEPRRKGPSDHDKRSSASLTQG